MPIIVSLSLVAVLAQAPSAVPSAQPLRAPAATAPDVLQVQVMLDRAGFSPGAIDGRMGANTKKALAAFQQNGNQVAPTEAVTTYRITPEDAAGPFISGMPTDMMEMAKLPALGYTSLLEMIAERFHSTPPLLQQLNPGASFAADQEIQVPNVDPMVIPVLTETIPPPEGRRGGTPKPPGPPKPDASVTVSQRAAALTVKDATGRVVFYAPVTTGSEHDPLPIGEWKVNGVQFSPTFRYNPDLFWDADPAHTKATIPAWPEQSCRSGVGRPLEGALRAPRHAGARNNRAHAVTRVHPPDQLGCAQACGDRQARHTRRVHRIAEYLVASVEWKKTARTFGIGAVCGFVVGAALVAVLITRYGPRASAPIAVPTAAVSHDDGLADVDAPVLEQRPLTGVLPGTATATAGGPLNATAPAPEALKNREFEMPVEGIKPEQLVRSFEERRSGTRSHEAIDILAPRNTR